jgi:CRISPR-associated endonuclease Csn1
MATMRYRLALDLGSTSLGWAMLRLNAQNEPCAIIKAGVRIFSDGRNPKDGSSLAVTRRAARAMRRRRDRLLKRKARMMHTLIAHGFFPVEESSRKALELLDPYALRTRGLDSALTGAEFARALFHINQRRGFKSNRKTDKKETDASALKAAIGQMRLGICQYPKGEDGKPLSTNDFNLLGWVRRELPETNGENIDKPRTVGERLHQRLMDQNLPPEARTVRARYREKRLPR